MEPKCNYCDFFGEKYHCNNCKIFNQANSHTPQEITCSLKELIGFIENTESVEEIEEKYGIGDYIFIETISKEKLKCVILDYGKDTIAESNNAKAKVTFGVLESQDRTIMNYGASNAGGYAQSLGKIHTDRFYQLMPSQLKKHILSVVKKASNGCASRELTAEALKVWMFSEIEIFGYNYFSAPMEGEQYEYFKKDESKRRLLASWLRSPCIGNERNFCKTDGTYGSANNAYGLIFGFCIGVI